MALFIPQTYPTNNVTNIPPKGKNILEARKSKASNIFFPNIVISAQGPKDKLLGIDKRKVPKAIIIVATFLFILNFSVIKATDTSNNEIVEVIAAIATKVKNKVAKKLPKGME